MAVNVLPVM